MSAMRMMTRLGLAAEIAAVNPMARPMLSAIIVLAAPTIKLMRSP